MDIAGETFEAPRLLIFRPGDRITVRATRRALLMFLGGSALEGPRYIWWNFVSSAANGSGKRKKSGSQGGSHRSPAKQNSYRCRRHRMAEDKTKQSGGVDLTH